MSYFQYQRIINVDWEKVQAFSQNGITWVRITKELELI